MLQFNKPVSVETVEFLGSGEPVSVLEVKAHARIEYDNEDSLIGLYINAAIERCELELQQKIRPQRVRLKYEGFGCSRGALLLSGLGGSAMVESLSYYTPNLVLTTLLPSMYRVVHAAQKYVVPAGYVPLSVWPDHSVDNKEVVITATAGMPIIPTAIKQWIMVQAATSFMNREAATERPLTEVGFIDRLLDPYRLAIV